MEYVRKGYVSDYSGSSSSWGSRSRSRGRSSSRGRGGSCFEENTLVWTKHETQVDGEAKQIPIKYLREGDLVGTMTVIYSPEKDPEEIQWTRATDVTAYDGNWKVHRFIFASGHQITVTSPHIMIIWPDRESYFVRADQVKIGDVMKLRQTMSNVTKIQTFFAGSKIAVETEDGTIQGNDVLASGFCDENPDMMNRVMKANVIVRIYKDRHFGQCYNTMCMDSLAWNNTYMINNGLIFKG